MDSISVLVADDHAVVREGLRRLLETEQDIILVGEAGNGTEAVEKVRRLHPDVVVLDISMPKLCGLDAAPDIRRESPETQVVVLSMHENEGYIYQMFRSGTIGYVLKGSPSAEILLAIRAAKKGEHFVSSKISDELIRIFLSHKGADTPVRKYDLLSDREQQTFRMMSSGYSTVQIAESLFLSPKTVEKHRANVMKKLALKNQIELVKFAISIGIIDLQ